MAKGFFEKLAKKVELQLMSEGLGSAEFDGYVNTGCYAFNALMSGTVFGGIPNNSVTALAGDPATGKTFFMLDIMKNFLDDNEDGGVMLSDSESAIREKMASSRGLDTKRIIVSEPATVEEFRTNALQFLEAYENSNEEDRPKLMLTLDSLGMLSTNKEVSDTLSTDEKKQNTKDMTRAALIKGVFRVLRLKMAKLKVPGLITNHTYDSMNMYGPKKEMGGGGGLKYAADSIVFLSKSKARVGDSKDGDVIGNKITALAVKSRLGRENSKVTLLLDYNRGLDKYYGLTDIALEGGVFKKLPRGIELPDGTVVFEKQINAEPTKYFTRDVLQAIDTRAMDQFRYGSQQERPVHEEDVLEVESAD
jgi:RecA/RadA recombinase